MERKLRPPALFFSRPANFAHNDADSRRRLGLNRKERRALGGDAIDAPALDARVLEGLAHQQAGRFAEAEDAYREVLAAKPDHADALHLLGTLALEAGANARAIELIDQAVRLKPEQAHFRLNFGEALRRAGDVAKAIAETEAALALKTDYADAHYNLGNLLRIVGRNAEALGHFERAAELRPDFVPALNNIGGLLIELGRAREAVEFYRRAVASAPGDAGYLSNLGNAYIIAGEAEKALEPLERAVALEPKLASALNNLGNVLRSMNRIDPAIEAYRRAIEAAPGESEAHVNLGVALQDKGDLAAAIAEYRKALALHPGSSQIWSNLGSALQDGGALDDAIAAFRRAIELDPKNATAHSNLIFALDFDPRLDAEGLQAERKRWWQAIGTPARPHMLRHDNVRDPEKKLRIGYVSSYFRWHSSAQAFAPVILAHDDARFEVACYSGGFAEDDLSRRLKAKAKIWRSTLGLSDDALADLVREDKIDVLVDCVGHMHGHRLEVFCRKPAPVQVTAWGQNNGTGIPLIDAIFVDKVLLPESERRFYAERPFDLPCAIMYMAPDDAPPPVLRPTDGPIVFGAYNRLSKMSDEALALWARVLAAVPESRMVFKGRFLEQPENQSRIVDAFRLRGIDPARLSFQGETPRLAHMASYGDIDIALDPLPQGGGISTLDALWMGVPVITLYGHNVSGRPTASVLSAIGLDDWIARTADDYVEIAKRKSAEREALASSRHALRDRIKATPVADAARYARAVEAAYRGLWKDFCAKSPLAPPAPTPAILPPELPPPPVAKSSLSRKERRAAAKGVGLEKLFAEALGHHKANRLGDAEKLYREILTLKPDHADALFLLGGIALHVGSTASAIDLLRRAISINPNNQGYHANLGEAYRQAKRFDEALAAFERSIALEPANPMAFYHKGLVLIARGQKSEAAEAYRAVVALDPRNHQALNNLGATYNELGRFEEAVGTFERALEIAPDDPMVLANLGHAETMSGRADKAVETLKRATRSLPSNAAAWGNLGNAYRALGRNDDALDALKRAVALAPKQLDLRVNYASALQEQGDVKTAIDHLSEAIELDPNSPLAWNNMGNALQELGHLEGALKSFRRALQLTPADWRVHTNVIFTNDFDPALDAAGLQQERKSWWRSHGQRWAEPAREFPNDRDPERRLRVGYVGPFFRWHSSSQAFANAILDADPASQEIAIYSSTAPEDDLTARFRAKAAIWVDARRLDDDALARRIRDDKIDILVDLCGHMGGTRLPLFCRKPAPLQVTAWGQANGTGIPTIDALFTDPIIMPVGERAHLTEKAVDLPCALAYLAPETAPEVAPLPALARGYLTFGSFNRMSKLNDATFDLWGGILRAVPDARLLFKGRYLDREPNQNPIAQALAQRGVARERLSFMRDSDRIAHLASFAEIDIQLDPTPQGGGISTLDALWMGVPVLTLHARTVNGRAAASVQTVLGLSEMIAGKPGDYVAIAARWATDIQGLAGLRRRLRGLMQSTPIANGPLYAQAVDAAYRGLWRDWCAKAKS